MGDTSVGHGGSSESVRLRAAASAAALSSKKTSQQVDSVATSRGTKDVSSKKKNFEDDEGYYIYVPHDQIAYR